MWLATIIYNKNTDKIKFQMIKLYVCYHWWYLIQLFKIKLLFTNNNKTIIWFVITIIIENFIHSYIFYMLFYHWPYYFIIIQHTNTTQKIIFNIIFPLTKQHNHNSLFIFFEYFFFLYIQFYCFIFTYTNIYIWILALK